MQQLLCLGRSSMLSGLLVSLAGVSMSLYA